MLTGKDLRAPDRAPPLRFAGGAAFCSSAEAGGEAQLTRATAGVLPSQTVDVTAVMGP